MGEIVVMNISLAQLETLRVVYYSFMYLFVDLVDYFLFIRD